MSKKMTMILALSTLVLSVCFIPAGAQDTVAPTSTPPTITAKKRALIKELLDASQITQTIDEGTKQMFDQVDRNYPQMLTKVMAEAGLLKSTSSEAFRTALNESQPRFSKQFRELYPKRVKMGEIIDKIYYPLYDEHFTADEIRDLVKFYKTPTGKKSIKALPKMMQAAMQEFGKRLNPEIIHLINELMEGEKKIFLAGAKAKEQEGEKVKIPPDKDNKK